MSQLPETVAAPVRASRGATLAAGLLLISTLGCSAIKKAVINSVAGSLGGASAFATDDDPELVEGALPFALKTLESLLGESPENPNLLLSACQGFTLYGAGFVEVDAEQLEVTSYREAKHQYERALKLYLRGRAYCFRALDLAHPGSTEALKLSPEDALAGARAGDVRLLFWSAAAWGSAISVGLDRPELVADLPAVRALLERALALDPTYDRGALYDGLMLVELAELRSGSGSVEKARAHFERALELAGGTRAGTYVAWAEYVAVPEQDRAEFEEMLAKALAVDVDASPEDRLANVIQQGRARWLRDMADELFLE